jgi:hypothetical protein
MPFQRNQFGPRWEAATERQDLPVRTSRVHPEPASNSVAFVPDLAWRRCGSERQTVAELVAYAFAHRFDFRDRAGLRSPLQTIREYFGTARF